MEVLVRELMDQKEILDPGRVAEGWQPVCAVSDRMREDNLWFMTNAVLVLSMNAAFGLLEAGCVRYKNVLNIMMKNLADLTLGGLVWWTCGYAFAFPSMRSGHFSSSTRPSGSFNGHLHRPLPPLTQALLLSA